MCHVDWTLMEPESRNTSLTRTLQKCILIVPRTHAAGKTCVKAGQQWISSCRCLTANTSHMFHCPDNVGISTLMRQAATMRDRAPEFSCWCKQCQVSAKCCWPPAHSHASHDEVQTAPALATAPGLAWRQTPLLLCMPFP